MLRILKYIGLAWIMFCITGCGTLGPRVLPVNRLTYNTNLENSENEQLLLNLVRLRYGDSPYFLNVDSIASKLEYQARISPDIGLTETFTHTLTSGTTSALTATTARSKSEEASGFVNFLEQPIISYRPLQGKDFVNQLLRPVDLEKMLLLHQSGWSIARILRVTVQSIGFLENAPEAARPTSKHVPNYQEFIEFSHTLRDLDRSDVIEITAKKIQKYVVIQIVFFGGKQHLADYMKLLHALRIKKFYPGILLVPADIKGVKENMPGITPRSVMGILYYLSKAVEPPLEDIKAGNVPLTYYPDGRLFDWQEVTKGMLHIYSSKFKPANANTAVPYRGYWFYIKENDTDSKETLSYVRFLFSLEAGQTGTVSPILSLSV